jgi:hypothetical protein
MRYLLLLVVGICAGYAIGFGDGRAHDKMIVQRIVEHIQNANHGPMSGDADKQLDDIQRH